uniref:Solute carrier family 22 member 15-like n=1 Tax=Phallusia mammillata TaxID=59560 RepID=A0A6F9DSJ1_9ASCI|nr:solute carrier family 22 member 15-like [Phallusia mammillata]
MDVDDCYTKVVGELGRYQLTIFCILNIFNVVLVPINLLVYFVGADPTKLAEVNFRVHNDSSIIHEWDLFDEKWISDLIQSLFYGGFLVGVITFGQLSDRYGRRKILILGLYLLFPASLITCFSTSWEMFAACRFVSGFLYGGSGLVLYVYLQELVGRSWWAITGSITNTLFSFGIAYMVLIAYFVTPWRQLVAILSVLQVIPLLSLWFIPESPRWLYSHGRLVEAEEVLVKIARKNGVQDPVIALVKKPVEKSKSNHTLIDLLRNRITLKRVIIMSFIWFVSSLVYYSLTLAAGDLGSNLYLNELLSGLVELPPQIWCLFLLNRKWAGRNRLLYSSYFISGLACLGLLGFKHTDKSVGKTILGLTGKMMISSSFNTLYVYTPELFPTSVRNVGLGTASMCARIGSILASFAKSAIEYNAIASYCVFGALGVFAGVLTLLLPETVGKKPPDSFEDLEVKHSVPNYSILNQNPSSANSLDQEMLLSCEENENENEEEDVML